MGEKMLQESDLKDLRADINKVAKIGIYHVDLITGVSYWDTVLKDIFEIPHDFEPYMGASDQFFPDPKQLELKHATYQKSIKNGTPFEMENQIVTAKGNHKTVRAFGHPTFKDGECVALSGGLMDVTGQKQTEHDLMQIKEQWDMAENIAKIGYWQWNIAEDHFKCSDNLRETYGIGMGTRINLELILSKVHRDDREMLSSNIKEFLKTKQFNKFMYRVCPNEGETRFLQAYGKVISNASGQAIEMVGTTQDITENLSQQQDLSQKNQLLGFAEEMANLGHWIIDLEKDTIEWSDTLYRLYDEELGSKITYESFLEKIHPEDRQTVIDHTRQAIKTGKKQEFIHRSYHQDGTIHYLKVIGKAVTNKNGWSIKLTGITVDITKEILRSQELETGNQQLKYAEELANFGFYRLDLITGIAEWSDNTHRIYGIPMDQKVTLEQYLSKIHPDDQYKAHDILSGTHDNESTIKFHHRTVPIDGKVKHIEALVNVEKDKNGNTIAFRGTVNDITEQVTNEFELRCKTQLLDIGETLANMAYWEWDVVKDQIKCSDNLYRIHGYDQGTPLNKAAIINSIHPEDREATEQRIKKYISQGVFKKFTHRIVHDNGTTITVEVTGSAVTNKGGKVIQINGVTQDVTETILREQELIRKNQLMQLGEQIGQMGFWQWFPEKDEFIWSDNAYRLLGLEIGSPMNLAAVAKISHPDDVPLIKSKTEEFLKTKVFTTFQYRIILPNGDIRTFELAGDIIVNGQGRVKEILGTAQDISERLAQQEEMIAQNQLMDAAEQVGNVGFWRWTPDDGVYTMSDNVYRIFGWEIGTPMNLEDSIAFVHPEDIPLVQEHTGRIFTEKVFDRFSYRILKKGTEVRWVEVNGSIVENNIGDIVEVTGTTQDITEKVIAKKALEEKNNHLLEAERMANLGHWQWNANKDVFIWSDNLYRIFGFELGIPMTMQLLTSKVIPEDMPKIERIIMEILENKEFPKFRYRIFGPDNAIKTLQIEGKITEVEGEILLTGVTQDISETVLQQLKLEEKNNQLQLAEKMAKMGNWHWDSLTNEVVWSDHLYEIFDHPKDQPLSYEVYLSYVHEEDYGYVKGKIDEARETGVYEKLIYRIRLKNGKIKTISSTGTVVCDIQGKFTEMMGTCQDVTEQVLKEHELTEKNLQLNFAEEMAGLGYWSWNVKTDDVQWSDNVYRIFEKEMHQKVRFNDAFDRTHPDDVASFQKFIDEIFKTKTFRPYQYRIVLENGIEKHVEIDARLKLNKKGEITHISGTVHDITQIIKDQEEKERRNQLFVLGERISKMGHWRWFPSTNELEWSDNIYRLYNVEIGIPVDIEFMANHIHPEDVSKLYDMMAHCLEQKSFKRWTHRIINENGFISTIEINGELIFDSKGNITEVIGTGQDVTDRLRTQEELVLKNKQLNNAEKMAKIGHWQWTIGEDNSYWSNNLYEIHGVEVNSEISVEKYLTFVHENDRNKVRDTIEGALESKIFSPVIYRIVLPNGNIKTMRTIGDVVLNESGEPVKLVGTIQDISEQITKELELEHKNDQLVAAEKMAKIGHWRWNLDSDTAYWSDNLYHIHGLPKDTVITLEKYFDCIVEEDREMVQRNLETTIATKKIEGNVYRISLPQGGTKTIKGVGKVILNQSGEVTELMGTCQDISDQVAREQELVEKNRMMSFAEELSGIGYWKWDVINDVIEKSENLLKILDFKPGTLLNFNKYLLRVHPKDMDMVVAKSQQIVREKTFEKFTHRIIRLDGSERTLELTGEVILNTAGNVIELIGSSNDITERINYEQELKQQNQLLKISEELSGIGHFKWNMLHEKFEISDNLYRILDLEPDTSMDYERYMECLHPEDRELVTLSFYDFLQKRKFEQFTHRIIRKNGTVRTLEVVGEFITDKNGVVEMIGTAQDITERRMAEIKFRGLLESAPDAMIITDRQGNIQFTNKQARLLLRYEPDELIGKPITSLYPNKFKNLHILYATQFLENPSEMYVIQNQELFIFNKRGERIPVQVSFGPVETADGLLISIAVRDITARRNAEQKIIEANKRLKETSKKLNIQNKQLSDFNHITSHNLRAPVSNLNSLLDLYLAEEDPLKREVLFRKFEKVIHHLSDTLETLIETLRIKSETKDNKTKLYFNDALQKTEELLTAQISDSEIKITSDFSHASNITYNQVYLDSIFLNLVSNAIKYRSPDRPSTLEVKSWKEGDKTLISFKDNGLGIDLKKHGAKLFGLNKVFHRHPEAKGVGLFLTKAQIEAMGGSIKVESTVGKGTTFIINLD
ncbi:PAS domain-containing sensor histidine kinase [Euzebyella saccharophila]|uniref:histidine kinase n=1 Tax=Euzebyella saccharophila TaxID=679664 RepID=A0ABV8JKG4_9FLAO|nr:PAS domain-containing protein [Euzebyella saccharophila]